MIDEEYKKIVITGTKGKTTIVRLLDHVLLELGFHTLRVDTDGHFKDGKQRSSYEESRKYWGMVPNVCPGRYLYDLEGLPVNRTVVLLEAAIGSSSLRGLGYSYHQIGVFTNVFEDHITKVRIKNRKDIYDAKRFAFTRLRKDGQFIYNSSDSFLAKQLQQEIIGRRMIAVGEELKYVQPQSFFKGGNVHFLIEGSRIFYMTAKTKRLLVDTATIPLSFNGMFVPNNYNIAFALGVLYAHFGSTQFFRKLHKIRAALESYTLDTAGGRLLLLQSKNKDLSVLIDFAHEARSLREVGKLAKKLSSNRVIGVLRLDPSRTNKEIQQAARAIKTAYDEIIIYDKVDGVQQKKSRTVAEGKRRTVGQTARLFVRELKRAGHKNVQMELREQRAFNSAVQQAEPGDVIVYIGRGEDHRKTYDVVKKKLRSIRS